MQEKIASAVAAFNAFAHRHSDVKAIISFGSSSGGKQDEYSDLDLFLFTTDTRRYLNEGNNAWLAGFEPVLSRVVIKDVIDNVLFNRIKLKNGLSLDIIIVDSQSFRKGIWYFRLRKYGVDKLIPDWLIRQIDESTYTFHYYLKRGYDILFDRINIRRDVDIIFREYDGKQDRTTTFNEVIFLQNYSQFWHTCYKIYAKLMRDDFFYAVIVLDNVIKKNLVRMLEWQVLTSEKKPKTDVFYHGAKIRQWCNPGIVEKLYGVFLHPGKEEMKTALLNTMTVYREVAHQIAQKFNFPLNEALEGKVFRFVIQGLSEEPAEDKIRTAITQIRNLAAVKNDLKAIISFGSTGSQNPDRFSDLDLYVFTTDLREYLNTEIWKRCFHNVQSVFVRRNMEEHIVLVLLENGLCIDIVLLNEARFRTVKRYLSLKDYRVLFSMPARKKRLAKYTTEAFYDMVKRGYEILYDKIGVTDVIERIMQEHSNVPDHYRLNRDLFYKNYHQFWQTNYNMEIKLKRGDFVYAVMVLDNLAKKLLVEMVEWFAQLHNPQKDVFYNGRKMQQWCDASLVNELMQTFLHSDIEQMQKAVLKSLDIYRALSHQVAAEKGFEINEELEETVYRFVSKNLKHNNY
ncbi:aminoglycoside 6-adenylyltransferase [[Flexibacter] sp. ATCC 35208]|uniref:aminoglycoside 6-adenylyltransferase n=1 Tax=[Flexibacter] sp. ATCC 35208 TaxID=1936242 RepID=UPI0009D292C5|nr:aminoglycoside 6-adenylyltransferase [[Flexibacter] sp. ATCC 35208]OMP77906.1 hypothetical protein BW716_17680 [[Flexibacter] sp. ATCC 35208]